MNIINAFSRCFSFFVTNQDPAGPLLRSTTAELLTNSGVAITNFSTLAIYPNLDDCLKTCKANMKTFIPWKAVYLNPSPTKDNTTQMMNGNAKTTLEQFKRTS